MITAHRQRQTRYVRRSTCGLTAGRPERIHPVLGGRATWILALAAAQLLAAAPAMAQSLSVSPDDTTPLVFSGAEGGPFTPATTPSWTLTNGGAVSLEYSATPDQPWLRLFGASGEIPESVLNRDVVVSAELTAEANSLAAGTYHATVTFTNLTNGDGTTTRRVELHVAPAGFTVSPGFVNATAVVNGASPAPTTLTLSSNGLVDLNYSLSWPTRPWLSVEPAAGTIPGGGEASVDIVFNTFGLAAGTYSVSLEVQNTTNGVGNRELPITLVVRPQSAGVVLLSPDEDVTATGAAGDIPATSQLFDLINTSLEAVDWIATADEPWVTVTPAGGTLSGDDGLAGGPDEQAIEIRVNVAADDLPAGSHTAQVFFDQVFINPVTGSVTELTYATRLVRVTAQPVLTVSLPLSGGRVSVSPPTSEIAGGATRSIQYEYGDVVTLSVSVDDGFQFSGWTADFDIDEPLRNPLVVTMDSSKQVTAIVEPIGRTLTLSTSGAGTGTVTASPTAPITSNALVSRYDHGTAVSLTATADDGSVFVGWAGNVPTGAAGENPLPVTMDRDRTITARFEAGADLAIEVIGGGTVELDPDLDVYPVGSSVTLTAVPEEGAVFAGWSGDATGAQTSTTIIVAEQTAVTATFSEGEPGEPGEPGGGGGENMARLIVDIQGDGVVTPPGGTFAMGARVTLIATPGLNSSFVRWESGATGTDLATVVLLDSDKSVRAVFAPIEPGTGRPQPGSQVCGAIGMLGTPMILAMGLLFMAPSGRRSFKALCR